MKLSKNEVSFKNRQAAFQASGWAETYHNYFSATSPRQPTPLLKSTVFKEPR